MAAQNLSHPHRDKPVPRVSIKLSPFAERHIFVILYLLTVLGESSILTSIFNSIAVIYLQVSYSNALHKV